MQAKIYKKSDATEARKRIFSKSFLAGLAFVLIILAFLGYGLNFIERSSFEVNGEKSYALIDEAMISMQYAKNLSDGNGLVWNADGERVEGYSNPLWVLVMTLVHLLPIPLTQTSYFVKLISLFFLLLNLYIVWRIAREFTESKVIPLLAVFLTAFYYPLNNWALHGLEIGFLALLLNAAVLISLRSIKNKKFHPLAYVLLAFAILLRWEATVIALILVIGMAWIDKENRKQHLQWGLGAVVFALAALTLFSLIYYGEWLPNSAYLLSGISLPLRMSLGLKYFWDFVWKSDWVLFVIPFSLLFLNRTRGLLLLFSIVLGQMAYSIFVGGDAWEFIGGANRFIAAVMPLFFILFVLALGEIAKLLIAKSKMNGINILSATLLVVFSVISLFSFNKLNVNDDVQVWTLEKKPVFTAEIERQLAMSLTLERVTTEDAVIAVTSSGTLPYFSGRTSIDLLGKNDAFISHGETRINSSLFHPGNFRPGHNKWNYAYSIGELAPDVIAQFLDNTDEELAPYLANYELIKVDGIPLYFRQDSSHVRWDLLQGK